MLRPPTKLYMWFTLALTLSDDIRPWKVCTKDSDSVMGFNLSTCSHFSVKLLPSDTWAAPGFESLASASENDCTVRIHARRIPRYSTLTYGSVFPRDSTLGRSVALATITSRDMTTPVIRRLLTDDRDFSPRWRTAQFHAVASSTPQLIAS